MLWLGEKRSDEILEKMASIQEKLAESLKVLKDYQDTHDNLVINGMSVLGEVHTRRLIANGYLQSVIKGWYIPSFPGSEGDTTVWYASYWNFLVAYANKRFGKDWCLTPEESLAFYAGETVAPKQLIIRAPKGRNNLVSLMFGDTMMDISASLPNQMEVDSLHGVHLYSLEEALVFCSPQYFKADALNARTCLCGIKDASEILKIVLEEGNTTRAGRIIGALRSVGRADVADEIVKCMARFGYVIRPENPFEDDSTLSFDRSLPAYATRIKLLWEKMRKQILGLNLPKPDGTLQQQEILQNMETNYVKDSYHSLSIEGYRVTEGLIEQVRSGKWDPKSSVQDADRKNALAARGYYQAFLSGKESVKKIFGGENPGMVFAMEHDSWHFELFQPCVVAGIIKATDLIGYRSHQVYIRGSKHTPLSPNAVRDAMAMLCELMKEEEDAFVRAILGHFFFAYIHPYMDGNGRTARFIMNVMLVTGGYGWTIVPVEKRQEYMDALEQASIQQDITTFARFISCLASR